MTDTFKCDSCRNKKHYTTGADEYPAYTTIEYCGIGYWSGGDIPTKTDADPWVNCKDYIPKTLTTP